MRLLERNQMYENRFSHSFSQMDGTRYNKVLGSTRGSLTSRHNSKLPQLNRSFSSSTAKSTIQKLSIFDQKVQDLNKKTHDLKLQTRESRRFASFLRDDLGQRLLMQHKNNLMQKINTLDKYAKMTRVVNEDRTRLLKQDCQRLNDSSINIKNLMYSLNERIDQVENVMGVYSGKQKHKI